MSGPAQVKSWSIAAAPENADRVFKELTDWMRNLGLEEHLFAIMLLSHEALNNAILHGCKSDRSLWVQYVIEVDATEIRVQVRDDGPGFDWRSGLKKEIPDSDREDGRGLIIYQLYADSVDFNDCGNQVTLTHLLQKEGR